MYVVTPVGSLCVWYSSRQERSPWVPGRTGRSYSRSYILERGGGDGGGGGGGRGYYMYR